MKAGDRVQLKWGTGVEGGTPGYGIVVEVTSSGGALPQPIVGVIVLWDGGILGRVPSNLIKVVS
jgi:hypothetical protein